MSQANPVTANQRGLMDRNVRHESDCPLELFFEILKFITVTPLRQSRAVCHQWKHLISSKKFGMAHRRQMLIQNEYVIRIAEDVCFKTVWFEGLTSFAYLRAYRINVNNMIPKDLVCSCLGLTCYAGEEGEPLVLWNPTTNQELVVPHLPISAPLNLDHDQRLQVSFLMGHHTATDDYKLIRMTFPKYGNPVEFRVYSRNENTWSGVVDCPYNAPLVECPGGVYAMDHVHWITRDALFPTIVSYSMSNGTFGIITSIECPQLQYEDYNQIESLDAETLVLYKDKCYRNIPQYMCLMNLNDYPNLHCVSYCFIFTEFFPELPANLCLQPIQFENQERTRILIRVHPVGVYRVFDLVEKTFGPDPSGRPVVYRHAPVLKIFLQTLDDPRHGYLSA